MRFKNAKNYQNRICMLNRAFRWQDGKFYVAWNEFGSKGLAWKPTKRRQLNKRNDVKSKEFVLIPVLIFELLKFSVFIFQCSTFSLVLVSFLSLSRFCFRNSLKESKSFRIFISVETSGNSLHSISHLHQNNAVSSDIL